MGSSALIPSATAATDDDVRWLKGDVDLSIGPPAKFDATALLMSPVLDQNGVESGWIDFARAHGIDESVVLSGYPLRCDGAEGRWLPSGAYVEEGSLDRAHLLAIARVLGETSQPGVVGFYRGYPDAERPYATAAVETIDDVEIGFVAVDLGVFMNRWGSDDWGHGFVFNPVSFIWPNDRSWFFHMDRDAGFAHISGSAEMIEELAALSAGEVWSTQPPIGSGRHVPVHGRRGGGSVSG